MLVLVMSPRREDDPSADTHSSDRALSEFLMRACHDLRTPLRSVRANAELVLRDAPDAQAGLGERLGFIVDGARRIEELADGLINYSLALEMDRGSFQRVRVDVLLRTALGRLEKELSASGAQVLYGELPRVLANPDRLMQVFEQLVRNAVDNRSQEPPLIRITAEQQGSEWLFAVHDNGIGIEPAYLESIFRPFERLNGRKTVGLGLTICRTVVERHGGRIWVESTPEKGSTFFFTLPAD